MKRYSSLFESSKTLISSDEWEKQDLALQNQKQLSRPGYCYRGMSGVEYETTIGSGRGVVSDHRNSFSQEGTNFSDDFGIAVDYAAGGRYDPRKTGSPSYVVEVEVTDRLKYLPRLGQYWAHEEIPAEDVTGVWKIIPGVDGLYSQKIH